MKKVIALFGLLLLMNTYSLKAQLPTCDKIYMDRVDLFFGLPINNSLYVYDPALPVSASNPAATTISYPAGCTGFTVSTVLGSTNPTRTFYTVNYQTNRIYYYDPVTLAWVNTGHSFVDAAAVNIAAGGGYIYSLTGATGKIYRYDGTGNASLLVTVSDFIGEGPYDLIADCDGNVYIFNGTGNSSPPFLRKYSSTGILLQEWAVNNIVNAYPAGGFAIVGNTFYTDDIDLNTFTLSIASGTITGNTIDINNTTIAIPTYGIFQGAGDMASCDAAIGIYASIAISSVDTEMCKSHAITLWASDMENGGGAPQYQWFVNGTPVPGATDTFYTYQPQNGDIVTCQLVSDKNCVVQTTVMSNPISITVEDPGALPQLSYSPAAFCTDYPTTILPMINTSGGTFSSTDGLSLNTVTGDITPSLSSPGEYVITYTNPPPVLCPQYSAFAIVDIYPPADATIEIGKIKQPSCLNDTVMLNAPGNAISYSWEPSDRIEGSSFESSAIIKLDQSSEITLTVIAKGGCTDTKSVAIEAGESCCQMFIPSAFTPNNDGFNDLFKIEAKDIRAVTNFRIFNRYGQQVFDGNNKTETWDGSFNDKLCDVGTYFYFISYSCDDGKQKEKKGEVTLIR